MFITLYKCNVRASPVSSIGSFIVIEQLYTIGNCFIESFSHFIEELGERKFSV